MNVNIDALFHSLNRPGHPGAAVAVLQGDEVTHLRCFGVANVEDDIAVTPKTVFRLGSTSKHICATSILLLENRGLLSLSDPVSKYIPEMPACASAITLKHLLTMTSGLHDGVGLTIFAGTGQLALTRAQHLDLVTRYERLMFEPGTATLYSNTNYLLLTLVIERVSGKCFRDFLAREIFQPLGMSSAVLIERMVEAVPHKARGYQPTATPGRYEQGIFLYEASGDGGIDLSMEDFIRWFRNYRNDRLVGTDYRERMEVDVRLPDGRPLEYALGLSLTSYCGKRKVSHAGGMPGYLADFNFYPDLDIGVLLLSNWMDPTLLDKADRIVDLITGANASRTSALFAKDAPAGFYLCASLGRALEIQDTPEGSRCFMMGEPSLLVGSRERGYEPAKRGSGYRIEPMTREGEILVSTGSGTPAVFTLWREPRETQPLDELAGRYRSALIGESHYVRVGAEGGIEITLDSALRRLSWKRCTRRAQDIFTADVRGEPTQTNLVVRFVRNGAGRVEGMTYTTNRCRDLLFAREDG